MNDKNTVMTPILAVISGFLGAGKTTLSTNLIAHLWERDVNAALITNDQSSGLVDSEIASAGGVNVREISGGCFCCRCDEFALALDEIVALRQADIIIAEAVGSCTDLVATVVEPLRIDLMKPYRVLPMTVVVDPERAEAVLGAESGTGVPPVGGTAGTAVSLSLLHDDVTYIFLKQLEEAQVILINKADSLSAERMAGIVGAMAGRFPEAFVRGFSAKSAADVAEVWGYLEKTESKHRPIQEIDYARYAKGEAMLGWLNAECRLECGTGVPPVGGTAGTAVSRSSSVTMDCLSDALGAEIHRRQVSGGVEIAHLKVSVVESSSAGECALSVVQCVSSGAGPQPVRRSDAVIVAGRVLINLRAQGDAAVLEADVRAAIVTVEAELKVKLEIVRLDSFAPGAPNPPYQRR